MADMVKRFKRHPAGKRPVPDYSDNLVVFAFEITGHRHSHGRRQGGAAVSGFPDIMLTLRTLHKAAQPVLLAQRVKTVLAAGKDLVDICLMPYVVYHFVPGTVITVVQGQRELHYPQIRAEVPAGRCKLLDQKPADFLRKGSQLLD
ncbi:hypothetical protein D3C73_1266390 [compost metagenome]